MRIFFLSILFFNLSTAFVFSKSHLIGLETNFVDGNKLHVLPGDTLLIEAGERPYLQIRNVHGSAEKNVVIINHRGAVVFNDDSHYYSLYLSHCTFFKLTGSGDKLTVYGIKVKRTGPKASGVKIDGGSTDFEVEYLEVSNTGFAGIMAKTDPDCDEEFTRGNFVMKNISIHDNYIHQVNGEGLYLGNSFYSGYDRNRQCMGQKLFPHEIHSLRVFDNKIHKAGWDGIQVGCATEDVYIYNNHIKTYGYQEEDYQGNGIQVGEGTRGVVAGNVVADGKGNGIIVLGQGQNLLINNLIINPGANGFFCDSRITETNSEIAFVNNTVIAPGENGFRIYSKITNNKIINNIVVSNNSQPYIKVLSEEVRISEENNLFLKNKTAEGISLSSDYQYTLSHKSPAYGSGQDISDFIKRYDCQFLLEDLEQYHQGYLLIMD